MGYRDGAGAIHVNPKKGYHDAPVPLPCKQCITCKLERKRQWAVRITHESQMHDQNCFITLTYSDDHLPDDGSLDVTHWQLFAKTFRNQIGKFRYYHCGEYGDLTRRPHYHAAIFGHDFAETRRHHTTTPDGHKLYTSPILDEVWGKGHALIGNLNFDTASYVAGYITKKINGPPAYEHYATSWFIEPRTGELLPATWLKPEYATMSRRPGIGSTWLDRYHTDVYPSDEVISNGKPARPPAYYDNKLGETNPKLLETIKTARAVTGQLHRADNTPARLATKAIVRKAKQKLYARDAV